jgi:hypothetical protein
MMSARDQLNSYIVRIERRLRFGAAVRGAAILASAALAATVILVLIANAFAFAGWSVTGARFVLVCALIYAATFALALPLLRLNRRRAAARAETAFPDFKQRLVTFAERDAASEPFMELLATDTLDLARSSEPHRLFTGRALLTTSALGLAALALLVWLIVGAPGFLGYGAALIWRGSGANLLPFYSVKVLPGDASVRRNTNRLRFIFLRDSIAPRNGTSCRCFRSPAARDSNSFSPDFPKASNITCRLARSARAISTFASLICPR